jgi:hypothetical protein
VDQVGPPSGLNSSDLWDLDIMLFPGPGLLAIYRKKKTTDPWDTTSVAGIIYSKQYDFATGASHWILNPDGTFTPGVANTFPRDIKSYRCMYAGFTGILNAASLTDQGMVVVAQVAQPYTWTPISVATVPAASAAPIALSTSEVDLGSTGQGFAVGINWVKEYITQGQQGPTFDNLMSVSPTAEQWRAKDGFYFPLRFGSGNFVWQDGAVTVNSFDYPWIYNGDGNSVPSNWNPLTLAPPLPTVGNTMCGAACFRGIASTTSLSITSRFGYEAMVEPSSGYRAFVTPSCSPSFSHVEKYFQISSLMSDVYPARYNEDDLLSTVIEGLSDMAGLASGIPGPIGMIGKFASPALGIIGGLLGKKRRQTKVAAVRTAAAPKEIPAPENIPIRSAMRKSASAAPTPRSMLKPVARVRVPLSTAKKRRSSGALVARGIRR